MLYQLSYSRLCTRTKLGLPLSEPATLSLDPPEADYQLSYFRLFGYFMFLVRYPRGHNWDSN